MFHRETYTQARIRTRQALRQHFGPLRVGQVARAMDDWDDKLVDSAVSLLSTDAPDASTAAVACFTGASVAAPSPGTVGAIGDGTIVKAILDFFKSPQGQQIIDAIVKLLLGLLV